MSVIALRMLLGVSLRWRLVIAIAVVGWLGVAWFGIVQADYRYRVLWGSLTIGMNMLLNVEALTDGFCSFGTRARRVLLAISLLAVALLVWRLAIDQSIAKMLAHAERQHESLGVLMIDADHFKQINDRYGHAGGDKVLQALVTSIRASLREGDVIGRVGGEEFVVLSPGTDLTAAQALGERVRQMVEHTRLPIDGELLQLTVSVGVAVAVAEEKGNAHVLRRADKALYAAKRDGRNRVMVAFTAEEGSHGASVSA
jgi:diguanylate cyclase (GGDEF)-like protein